MWDECEEEVSDENEFDLSPPPLHRQGWPVLQHALPGATQSTRHTTTRHPTANSPTGPPPLALDLVAALDRPSLWLRSLAALVQILKGEQRSAGCAPSCSSRSRWPRALLATLPRRRRALGRSGLLATEHFLEPLRLQSLVKRRSARRSGSYVGVRTAGWQLCSRRHRPLSRPRSSLLDRILPSFLSTHRPRLEHEPLVEARPVGET